MKIKLIFEDQITLMLQLFPIVIFVFVFLFFQLMSKEPKHKFIRDV